MTKKELRYAFNKVINVAMDVRCEDLHHPNNQTHEPLEQCRVEYEISRQVWLLRQHMKEIGL
jgi:hypothetical protein